MAGTETVRRLAHTGYGQLELNKVAFRRTGRIEAQCALDTTDFTDAAPAENGMLLRIDPVAHKVYLPDAATDKVLLNYTTEHMYDERKPELKNFCLKPGTFLPRLAYLERGDVFTTNTVSFNGDTSNTYAADESTFFTALASCGTSAMYGCPHTDGTILVSTTSTNAVAQVVGKTTMPDGQVAIKFIAL